MNYSGATAKLMDKVCKERNSGPADGFWEFKGLSFGY